MPSPPSATGISSVTTPGTAAARPRARCAATSSADNDPLNLSGAITTRAEAACPGAARPEAARPEAARPEAARPVGVRAEAGCPGGAPLKGPLTFYPLGIEFVRATSANHPALRLRMRRWVP